MKKSLIPKLFVYVKQLHNTEPEYLWASNPEFAVFRNRRNKKWYGIVMTIPRSRFNLPGEGNIDVINVKIDYRTFDWEALQDTEGFYPAYHMNKKHWISILLDGTVKEKVVEKYLDNSYELISKVK